jgi:hypothetical protein
MYPHRCPSRVVLVTSRLSGRIDFSRVVPVAHPHPPTPDTTDGDAISDATTPLPKDHGSATGIPPQPPVTFRSLD